MLTAMGSIGGSTRLISLRVPEARLASLATS